MPYITYESDDDIHHRQEIETENRMAPLREEIYVLKEELKERDAMLCAILGSTSQAHTRRAKDSGDLSDMNNHIFDFRKIACYGS